MTPPPGPTPPRFTAVSAGSFHACALTDAGKAYCWGARGGALLGDGITSDLGISTEPVAVQSAAALASLSAGEFHSCATTSSGGGYCWGSNTTGRLGDGTTTDRAVPTAVTGSLVFRRVAAGGLTGSCGVTTTDVAYCWGKNQYGALGIGSSSIADSSVVPVKVAGTLAFADIGVGAGHACGLTTGGKAYCWGLNLSGELGDGTTTDRNAPTAVAGGLQFRALAVGYDDACGLIADGTAYCWGGNSAGQLGVGALGVRTSPTIMAGGVKFASIAMKHRHGCGLTSDGTAYCWGANDIGQLGDGTLNASTAPVKVAGNLRFSSISVGAGFTCAVSTAGAVNCWGANQLGQLGDGTTVSHGTPKAITTPST